MRSGRPSSPSAARGCTSGTAPRGSRWPASVCRRWRSAHTPWTCSTTAVRDVVVVGQRVGAAIGAVWEWQAATGWVQVVAASSFGAAVAHFGFDPIRFRQVAIVRPTTSTPFTADEVWERDAGSTAGWTLRGGTPSPTGDGPLAWDPVQARLLIVSWYIGGPMLGYTGANPALYHVHGSGCTGSPSIADTLHTTSPATMPYAGQPFVAGSQPDHVSARRPGHRAQRPVCVGHAAAVSAGRHRHGQLPAARRPRTADRDDAGRCRGCCSPSCCWGPTPRRSASSSSSRH